MWPRKTTRLEPLDLSVPDLAPRSRLFALPPHGIGTDRAESLSSYLVRLARAHAVNPRHLIRKVFVPAATQPERLGFVARYTNYLSTLDGVGQQALDFSGLISELTTVANLRYLTLLPLAGLLPRNGAGQLAPSPRWCPSCVADQVREKAEMARPLLWSLDMYRVCHRHGRRMVSACPQCGKEQPYVPAYPDLWRCDHCGSYLGDAASDSPVDGREPWVAESLADLVANLPNMDGAEANRRFVEYVRQAVASRAGGNQAALCQAIGLPAWTMKKWLAQGQRPSLPQILAVCYGLGVRPAAVFLDQDCAPSTSAALQGSMRERAARPTLDAPSRRRIGQELAGISADPLDTRSLASISRNLGLKRSCLKYWFPKECRVIRAKHAQATAAAAGSRREHDYDNIRKVVLEVIARGEYPGRRKVNEGLLAHSTSLSRPDLLRTYRDAVERWGAD